MSRVPRQALSGSTFCLNPCQKPASSAKPGAGTFHPLRDGASSFRELVRTEKCRSQPAGSQELVAFRESWLRIRRIGIVYGGIVYGGVVYGDAENGDPVYGFGVVNSCFLRFMELSAADRFQF